MITSSSESSSESEFKRIISNNAQKQKKYRNKNKNAKKSKIEIVNQANIASKNSPCDDEDGDNNFQEPVDLANKNFNLSKKNDSICAEELKCESDKEDDG